MPGCPLRGHRRYSAAALTVFFGETPHAGGEHAVAAYLKLFVYGNNLADKAYKTDAQEFSNIGGIRTVYYGAPRTVTLRLTARY